MDLRYHSESDDTVVDMDGSQYVKLLTESNDGLIFPVFIRTNPEKERCGIYKTMSELKKKVFIDKFGNSIELEKGCCTGNSANHAVVEPYELKPCYPDIEPDYYKSDSGFQVIDVIDAFKLNFNLGNVVKYTIREKEDKLQDLRKARWYIDREIQRLERTED